MTRDEKEKKVKEILKKHDIRMSVWAMEGLEVKFEYKGESIVDDGYDDGYDFIFDMFHD